MALVVTTNQLFVKTRIYDPTDIKAKTQVGDSSVWSAPGYKDSHWSQQYTNQYHGIWWARTAITINNESKRLGVMIETSASYDVFINGHKLGSNGKVGSVKTDELPGQRINYFLLPDTIVKGSTYLLALRLSNFYDRQNQNFLKIIVQDYFSLVRSRLMYTVFIHMLAGIFLIVGIYYFFLYLISFRYPHFLFFGILCFLFFLMIVLEYMKTYYLYPYIFQYFRLFGIAILSTLISIILLTFLFYRFKLNHLLLYTSILLLIVGILWIKESYWDDRTKSISMAGLTLSSFVSLYTVYKKKNGAPEIFYGIIACLSCYYYFDITFYLGSGILVICVLISLSKELLEQKRIKEAAVLRSNRLEIELLKKTLQPHFLINSLSALMEFIETAPQKSLPFISALANEFDILNDVSAHKLILIEKEIELCRSYLKIMSFRKDRDYQLELINIDRKETIPPAVFLTILENGIMHNLFETNPIVFTIQFQKTLENKIYIIHAPGKPKSIHVRERTGLKYIKARLEESYSSFYSFSSGQVLKDGWETKIYIKNNL